LAAERQHPEATTSDTRAGKRTRLLKPSFRLSHHIGLFVALTAASLAAGVWLASRSRAVDLWIIPAYLFAANVVEYLVHRLLMHRPLWPRRFYSGHTLVHHRAFHHDSMEVTRWRELELVMMPRFTMALFFVGMTPIVALVGWALGPGVAGLWALTAVATFVSYEVLHALYHLPLPVLRRLGFFHSRVFCFLYRHHLHHHRLVRMHRTNFNISIPLSDRLFGSLEDEADWLANKRSAKSERVQPGARAKAGEPQLDVVRAAETGRADRDDDVAGDTLAVPNRNHA
jgi:hypothetical protein